MRNKKLIGLGLAGAASFLLFVVNAIRIFEAFNNGASDSIEGLTMLFAFVGLVAAGILMGFFKQELLEAENNKKLSANQETLVIEENSKDVESTIDEGKLLGGVLLTGAALFEFSTNHFTSNYLVPYQDTELLRNIFSSGLFPVVIGLWGLKNIYFGIKPYLDKKVIAYMDKNDL